MMTTHPDPLAAAWLARVDSLARALPAVERSELLADLREHIDVALPAQPTRDQVRVVLDRLGDPADVVAAAVEDGGHRQAVPAVQVPPPPPPASTAAPVRGTTTAERLTLAALLVAGLVVVLWPLALLLWIGGLVGLLAATRWRGAEIGVALALPVAVAVIGISPALVFVTATTCESVDGGGEVCTSAGGSPIAGLVALLLALGIVVGVVLGVRWLARRVDGRPSR